ncbi:Mic26p [Sporobolomyces salmoneus]|uniref:Mic26p n=1 Tax=Sporobolomyces salmoneus TaxID=183962 RepID=UPI0031785576
MPVPLAAKLFGGSLSVATAGLVASRTNTVLADSTTPFLRPESVEEHRSKLPLYEQQSTPITLVPEKSLLQDEVSQVRAVVQDATRGLRSSTADGRATWMSWERKAEDSLQQIISPRDQLNPGAMYVAVATLAGSILGRNRNILLRAVLPPAFLLVSLDYFLPNTASNLWRKAETLEAAHFPQLRQLREQFQSLPRSSK